MSSSACSNVSSPATRELLLPVWHFFISITFITSRVLGRLPIKQFIYIVSGYTVHQPTLMTKIYLGQLTTGLKLSVNQQKIECLGRFTSSVPFASRIQDGRVCARTVAKQTKVKVIEATSEPKELLLPLGVSWVVGMTFCSRKPPRIELSSQQ